MSTPVERLLATAAAEIGYHEKASNKDLDSKTANSGNKNYTKYARDLDALGDVYNGKKQGYDWCDQFVDWCFITTFGKELGMKLLCQAYKGLGAGTKYSMQYYQAKGQFHTKNPQSGDQIFFGTAKTVSHTGLVEKVKGSTVYTIEGNTKGGVQVARKSYAVTKSTILGYGRPDWTLVKEPTPSPAPEPAPTPEKEDDEMLTYDQFKEYMTRYEAERRALPGSESWGETDRAWAVEKGIFQGDGKGNMMWQDYLTREQAAALLHRTAG